MAQSIKTINKKQPHLVKEKHNHVFLMLFLVLIATVAVVYGILFLMPRETSKPEDQQGTTSNTEDTAQKSDQQDNQKTEETTNEAKPESEKNNPQYEGKDPNTYEALTGIVNYFDFSEGNLKVIARFDQFVSGTCNFTLTSPSGKTTSTSGALVAEQSTSACELNIPSNEHGNWKVTITATAGNKRGAISREDNL